MAPPDAAKLKRLTNLLQRGRGLHFDNARLLYRRVVGENAPTAIPPLCDVVFRAAQLGVALIFIEDRAYLNDNAYDAFTDTLFAQVAGEERGRLYGMVQTYGAAVAERQLGPLLARDLAAAMGGYRGLTEAYACSAASLSKTTQLYVAMAFNDRSMVQRLQ